METLLQVSILIGMTVTYAGVVSYMEMLTMHDKEDCPFGCCCDDPDLTPEYDKLWKEHLALGMNPAGPTAQALKANIRLHTKPDWTPPE